MNKHEIAQEYEFNFTKLWIREHFEFLKKEIPSIEPMSFADPTIDYVKEFFDNNDKRSAFVAAYIKDKSCLEIGAGACGAFAKWKWINKRTVIEPLLHRTDEFLLSEYGYTWYDNDIVKYSQNAEEFIPELENMIDGLIVCRNVLDHTEDPYKILNNISKYAIHGCFLMLWNDLYHKEGPDEGHFNITEDKNDWKKTIESYGFRIITEYEQDRPITINYGCLARRKK
jgi:hypothetical protein